MRGCHGNAEPRRRLIKPMSNMRSIRGLATKLTGIQAVHPPDAPGATIVMGLLEGEGQPTTFAGCSLDPDRAFQACVGEAAEFLAQSDPRAAIPSGPVPEDAVDPFATVWTEPPKNWLAGMTFPSGIPVSLPAASCCYLRANTHLDVSTGCAAGATVESAGRHALCELIERDTARRWWCGSHAARLVDVGQPALARAIAWLSAARRERSDREVTLLDIAGDAVVPVIAAVSFLRGGGGFVVGTAAHPDLPEAAIGALREMVQMEFGLVIATVKRDRLGYENLSQSDLRHLLRAETIRPDCTALTPEPGTRRQASEGGQDTSAAGIARRLAKRGHQIYAARLSDDPFLPVMRMLVTGMPIARRAKLLTYTNNHWNFTGNAELY
ncbi:YcaO-like family protein [Bradyrhizobium sp. BRP14]|nr:YcaO-like family protein [Bradyrhizobium sp. BRP14]